ncbi:hypothetical protein ACJX0J_033593, partial [Zea mays]
MGAGVWIPVFSKDKLTSYPIYKRLPIGWYMTIQATHLGWTILYSIFYYMHYNLIQIHNFPCVTDILVHMSHWHKVLFEFSVVGKNVEEMAKALSNVIVEDEEIVE